MRENVLLMFFSRQRQGFVDGDGRGEKIEWRRGNGLRCTAKKKRGTGLVLARRVFSPPKPKQSQVQVPFAVRLLGGVASKGTFLSPLRPAVGQLAIHQMVAGACQAGMGSQVGTRAGAAAEAEHRMSCELSVARYRLEL